MTTTPIGPPPSTPQPQAPADSPAVVAPPEADEGTNFLDPEHLNDLERQIVGAFETRAEQSSGPSTTQEPAVTPPEEVAGGEQENVTSPAIPPTPPVATPQEVTAPAVTPQPEPSPQASGPVGELPYDPFAIPAPPTAPEQPEPVAAAPQPGTIPPGYVDFMGTLMPVAQANQMQETYRWAQELTPEESNAINQYVAEQRTQRAAAQQPAVPPTTVQPPYAPGTTYPNQTPPPFQQQPVGPPPVAAPPAPPDISQIEDPAVAAYLQQQAAWQAQQQQLIIQQQQMLAQMAPALNETQQMAQAAIYQQRQAENTQSNQRIDQAKWDFAAKYQLTSADMEVIEQRLVQSNLVPELISRRDGDIYSGVIDGFETVSWTSPDIRQRLIATQVAPALTDDRETRERAAKLGALAGSGGSVTRSDSAPVTPQDRHAAMVAEIATAMNQNPS